MARVADLAEGAVGQVRVRITPNRVIQEIECLETELQERRLAEMEVLQSREIPVHNARPNDGIAPYVAEAVLRLRCETGGVEPFEYAALVAGQCDRQACGVGAVEVAADVRNVAVVRRRQ